LDGNGSPIFALALPPGQSHEHDHEADDESSRENSDRDPPAQPRQSGTCLAFCCTNVYAR
jgi:hypothetical protein